MNNGADAYNFDIVIDDSSEDEGRNEWKEFVQSVRSVMPHTFMHRMESVWDESKNIQDYTTRVETALSWLLDERHPGHPSSDRASSSANALDYRKEGAYRARHRSPTPGPVAGPSGVRTPKKPAMPKSIPKNGGSREQVESRYAARFEDGFARDRAEERARPVAQLAASAVGGAANVNGNAEPAPKAPAVPVANAQEQASLATVLSIVPDVQPDHVLTLLRSDKFKSNAEAVLDEILSDPLYPKIDKSAAKGKKRARDDDAEAEEPKRNYLEVASRQRPGGQYENAALLSLYADFPNVAQNTIATIFKSNSSYYATAYVAVKEALDKPEATRGWKTMTTSAASRRKGKTKDIFCFELESEKAWLLKHLAEQDAKKLKEAEEEKRIEAEIASGAFFECGCCFGETALSQMVSCSNGCPFCRECATANANNQVGMRKYVLPCMSVDGCASVFPEAEYDLYLPPTTIAALHKIKQEKEVALADLDDLETCPFCPFAMCVDNPDERLFRCQREDCLVVSCRKCKKEDHLPFTCEEADKDKKINSIHRVEEAMSEALIRRCPNKKCNEPYLKTEGCNKIICTSCRTMSCYICGKVVTGYHHFRNAGSNATHTEKGASCDLWDNTAERSYKEIEQARVAALAAVQSENPALKEDDAKHLTVEKPPAAPGPPRYAPYPAPLLPDRAEVIRRQAQLAQNRALEEARQRAMRERLRDLQAQQRQRAQQAEADREARRQQALHGVGARPAVPAPQVGRPKPVKVARIKR